MLGLHDLTTDTEFDAYWEEEARNPHRNRIRIGRQYQATIPRLLSGEVDGRKLDQLETLAWRRETGLGDDKLDDYFFTSRALALLARFKAKETRTESTAGAAADTTSASGTAVAKNGICSADSQQSQQQSHRPGPKSRKEFEERKAMLTAELVNLTAFVTSHHPSHSDSGCRCKDNDVRSEKWSVTEARLFAHALEHYGKNFGAIKKAMPWKPAKSLIDHYYKKADGDAGDGDQEDGTVSDGQDLSPNDHDTSPVFSKTDFPTSLQVSCFTSNERFEGQSINWKKLKDHQKNGDRSDTDHLSSVNSMANSGMMNSANDVMGAEIKPVKAKPIFPSEPTESIANGNSLLGSLKFFMDGQLVLKLNANQQESDKKCHWVESQDTPKIVKSVRNKKYKQSKSGAGGNGTTDPVSCAAGGETSSSKASDTGDEESRDSSSLGSVDSESRSLPSPSDWKSVRKAKVKVENNCQVPIVTSAELYSLSPTPGERTPVRGQNNNRLESITTPASATVTSPAATGVSAASSPVASSSGKRVPEFSAFPFDDQSFAEKKVRKRLKPTPASTNHHKKLNHKSTGNHTTSSPSAKSTGVFPRPENPSLRSGSRGPPAAHSSTGLMDLSSKSSTSRTNMPDENCGLDLSVKPATRSSSGGDDGLVSRRTQWTD